MRRLVEDVVVASVGVPAIVWSFAWIYFISTPASAWFWSAVALTVSIFAPMPVFVAVVDGVDVLKSLRGSLKDE